MGKWSRIEEQSVRDVIAVHIAPSLCYELQTTSIDSLQTDIMKGDPCGIKPFDAADGTSILIAGGAPVERSAGSPTPAASQQNNNSALHQEDHPQPLHGTVPAAIQAALSRGKVPRLDESDLTASTGVYSHYTNTTVAQHNKLAKHRNSASQSSNEALDRIHHNHLPTFKDQAQSFTESVRGTVKKSEPAVGLTTTKEAVEEEAEKQRCENPSTSSAPTTSAASVNGTFPKTNNRTHGQLGRSAGSDACCLIQ